MKIAKELWNKYKSLLTKEGINTPLRLAHFFGQSKVESDLKPKIESMNYSVEGLIKGFGRHRISLEDAKKFGRTTTQKANQKEIANRLYGGAWGKTNLGNTQPNDGWLLRGAGLTQVTGRANFQKLSDDTGIDFINHPELILQEAESLIASVWFWNYRGLNKYADKDDILSISKIINLGSVKASGTPKHLAERKQAVETFKKIFK
jgi:putative chitinase